MGAAVLPVDFFLEGLAAVDELAPIKGGAGLPRLREDRRAEVRFSEIGGIAVRPWVATLAGRSGSGFSGPHHRCPFGQARLRNGGPMGYVDRYTDVGRSISCPTSDRGHTPWVIR